MIDRAIEAFWAAWPEVRPMLEAELSAGEYGSGTERLTELTEAIQPELEWELMPGQTAEHALCMSSAADPRLRMITQQWVDAAPAAGSTWEYHPARIAIGLEPPPIKMLTYIGAVTTARDSNLQRWWFTPDYDCVRVTPDRLAMELVGQAVQLQTEDKVISPDGRIVDSGAKPGKAAVLFSTSFTRQYSEIARASPVFGQLRNQIDMLVADQAPGPELAQSLADAEVEVLVAKSGELHNAAE